MGNLRVDPVDLLLRLDALAQVGLAVVIEVQDLMLALEACDLGFLGAEVPVQLGDAGVDVVGRLLDDFLLLLDGVVVIDGDHLVQDVSRPLRGRIVERKVDDTVGGTVPVHAHLVAVRLGHAVDVAVPDDDRIVVEQLAKGPSGSHGDTAETGGNRVAEMAGHGLELADLDDKAGILAHGHHRRGIVGFADIHHLHADRRLLVQVLHPLDELGLVEIGRAEAEVLGHFQHRGFRAEDDDFVIDGVHRDGDTAVRDVLQRRGPAFQPVPGDGVQADLGVALIDPVRPVAAVIGDAGADGGTEDKPVQIPEDGIEDIFPGEGIGVFLLQEGEVGFILIDSHGQVGDYLFLFEFRKARIAK